MSLKVKCKGVGCPIKENCYRYMAEDLENQQYYTYTPYKHSDINALRKCDEFIPYEAPDKPKHRCEAPNESKFYIYGDAIYICYEDDLGELIVSNGEYGSQVNYCPYCGYKAKNKIKSKWK